MEEVAARVSAKQPLKVHSEYETVAGPLSASTGHVKFRCMSPSLDTGCGLSSCHWGCEVSMVRHPREGGEASPAPLTSWPMMQKVADSSARSHLAVQRGDTPSAGASIGSKLRQSHSNHIAIA